MKKLIAIIFTSSLLLAGCNTVAPTTPTESPRTTVKDIQSVVVTACGFLPAATTIASIVSASPAVMTASQIAELICKAVTPKVSSSGLKSAYAPKSVIVGDKVILINGEFIKK